MSPEFSLEGLIKANCSFTTPTFVATATVDKDAFVISANLNFRDAKEPFEYLLFFEYDDLLYYSNALEFRYIENNVLFLLVEYKIDKFSLLRRVLNSSYEKEEGIDVNIQALVYHTKHQPKFSYPLYVFEIEPDFRTDVWE